ncbi:MAG TPA: GDP-mannose 4,6-dehydratase, partial [Candidatus Competibacteraceae bacterium]|nr:GDP-mannose 4,6-dehydratase [Candidatus Competibacteraceae bacterium]
MNPAFWPGRRVLVTGHTGFKGGWLSLWLQRWGAEVTGYALIPPTEPSLFETACVGEGMQSVLGDVRDFAALRAIVADCRPEIVFHLAAQPLVVPSYQQPVETYATNIMGTVHLLEAVRQVGGVRAVVNVTSDKCYANREWLWGYRENEPMGGDDPYSSSKGCAELVTAAYRASFFPLADYAQHGV